MHRNPHVLEIKLSVSTWRAGGERVCVGKPRAHVQVISEGDGGESCAVRAEAAQRGCWRGVYKHTPSLPGHPVNWTSVELINGSGSLCLFKWKPTF